MALTQISPLDTFQPTPMTNSINRQQLETNRADLQGEQAVAKLCELVEAAQTCFFCTAVATGNSSAARPMNVRRVDDRGRLWFLSARDSHTVQEVELDPAVRLFFQGSPHSEFLAIIGEARLATSRETIEQLREPVLGTGSLAGSTTRGSRSSKLRR